MNWNECFGRDTKPDLSQIRAHIGSPLWTQFCDYLEQTYNVQPRIEHSRCGGAPGWNVKYKRGSHALCTLYPDDGSFICLLVVGGKEAAEAELLLNVCTEYVNDLYRNAKPYNGARWLMIRISAAEVLEDVKKLIGLRIQSATKQL